MLLIKYDKRFLKSLKRANLNQNEKEDLEYIIKTLREEKQLDARFKKHNLKGDMQKYIDIHIRQNIILLVKITADTLSLYNIGTHAEVLHL